MFLLLPYRQHDTREALFSSADGNNSLAAKYRQSHLCQNVLQELELVSQSPDDGTKGPDEAADYATSFFYQVRKTDSRCFLQGIHLSPFNNVVLMTTNCVNPLSLSPGVCVTVACGVWQDSAEPSEEPSNLLRPAGYQHLLWHSGGTHLLQDALNSG